ncbi:MAG: ATP12 family protein, partial [Pseudomonadota bacterium]
EPVERVEPLDAGAAADGHDRYQIKLSGRTIKTPARQTLALPTEALAEAIADEWRAQGDLIDPQSMPLTKLANTTCDGILARADDVRAEILAFVGRDLVCYCAATPFDLFERQQTQWAPALRWAERTFGCPLVTTEGLMPIEQPTEVLAGAKSAIDRLAPWQLGAVHVITTLTGSGVMALMLANEAILPESVWDAAHVDDTYQAEQWGADAEAEARLDYRKAEMLSACRFLEAVREGQEH